MTHDVHSKILVTSANVGLKPSPGLCTEREYEISKLVFTDLTKSILILNS